MKEKTKRKQMSLLDPIVDLILGYSDIDFEKIIQEEREKADRRRDRTPAGGSPPPDRKQHCPCRPPDSYRDNYLPTSSPLRDPPAPVLPGRIGKGGWG